MTLLFNVLVTASPKELAGDVGSLRGTTNNLAAAVGTAVAGALVVGLLSASVMRYVVENPIINRRRLKTQVDLDNINFVSNDRLFEIIAAHDRDTPAGGRGDAHQRGMRGCARSRSGSSSWRARPCWR